MRQPSGEDSSLVPSRRRKIVAIPSLVSDPRGWGNGRTSPSAGCSCLLRGEPMHHLSRILALCFSVVLITAPSAPGEEPQLDPAATRDYAVAAGLQNKQL